MTFDDFMEYLRLTTHNAAEEIAKTTVVVCPAVKMPAEIALDADGHMDACSRWPEFEECSQSCRAQAQFSAESAEDFSAHFEGKACSVCGNALTREDWYKSRLAIAYLEACGTKNPQPDPDAVLPDGVHVCATCFASKKRAA